MLARIWTLVGLAAVTLAVPLDQLERRATVSPDATCGGAKGYTCLGSSFGNCCSPNGWWYASRSCFSSCFSTADDGSVVLPVHTAARAVKVPLDPVVPTRPQPRLQRP